MEKEYKDMIFHTMYKIVEKVVNEMFEDGDYRVVKYETVDDDYISDYVLDRGTAIEKVTEEVYDEVYDMPYYDIDKICDLFHDEINDIIDTYGFGTNTDYAYYIMLNHCLHIIKRDYL